MKKLFVLLLVALIAACAPTQKDQAVVKGKLDGIKSKTVKIYQGMDVVTEIDLKEDGTFNGPIALSGAAYYTLRADRNSASLFLKPGVELSVNFANNDFTFTEGLAKENTFLKEKAKNNRFNVREVFAQDEAKFTATLDSLEKARVEFANKYFEENKLDADFVKFEKADIGFSVIQLAGMYEGYHGYFIQNREFKVSENYNDRTADLDTEKGEFIILPSYKELLSNVVSKKVEKNLEGKEDADEKMFFDEQYKVIKSTFKNADIVAAFHFDMAKESIRSFGVKKSEDFLKEFTANCKDNAKLAQLDKMKIKYAKTDIGAVAPDFTLTNLKGETVTLSSLKGKLVVVDFWATWCGPCRGSFPGMQKAVDTFTDVEFLFVNTWERVPEDQKKDNAEKFMTQNKYNLNVLIDGKNEVVAKYNVPGIPAKFLIGKDGTIKDKKVGSSDKIEEIMEEMKKWAETAE